MKFTLFELASCNVLYFTCRYDIHDRAEAAKRAMDTLRGRRAARQRDLHDSHLDAHRLIQLQVEHIEYHTKISGEANWIGELASFISLQC